MTDKELKDLVASLSISQKETDRQIKELGKQIGGLGRKFGGFTEGMAFPAMEKVLRQKFKMESIAQNLQTRIKGKEMEIDILAYSNSRINKVYLVEVKSHLNDVELKKMLLKMKNFFYFHPEHKGKDLYGILTVVDVNRDILKRVYANGIYLARLHDETFTLQVPKGFKPKNYSI